MLHLFLISCRRFIGMAWSALARSPDGQAPVTLRRILVMLGFLPVFVLVQAIHWLGFLLDDLFFRGWRRVQVKAPLFVLGVPRSGTTNLHQVLARDAQFTTFSTWECLFALSVTERRFWLALARLDARLGRPAGRLLGWVERRVFASLDDVHAMDLGTPEEDYFALMPVLACFILALPFPASEQLWRVGRFDEQLAADERRRILDYYHACLQKHLYVHGRHKRLLSKNAAFAPLANSLAERFPDARFIVCLRDPMQTVPSQLSSIAPGLAFFGVPADSPVIRERFLDQLAFYYRNLGRLTAGDARERSVTVTLPQLKQHLDATLTAAYGALGLPLSRDFARTLRDAAEASRSYRSGHSYGLAQVGLDNATLDARFDGVWPPQGVLAVPGAPPSPGDTDAGDTGAEHGKPAAAHRMGKAPEHGPAPSAPLSTDAGGALRC